MARTNIATLVPEDDDYAPFEVSNDFLAKHNPQPGGYYVEYDDGYKSYSPPEAFEAGYALIEAGNEGKIAILSEDFTADQWWLPELDAAVANGTPDQKRAVAVVRNLLAQIAASEDL